MPDPASHPAPGDAYRSQDGDWVEVLVRGVTPEGTEWVGFRPGTDPDSPAELHTLAWFVELVDVGAIDGKPRPRYQLVQGAVGPEG